ncbi:MAG: hypothetical protein H6744_12770 [Deltaproteobacteria bacterium]|nr:hypothetical protein [Deltaproteobacteria bacterium]MCB9787546.1 hypothetical protein [Deltaproteobacteria bacterium]
MSAADAPPAARSPRRAGRAARALGWCLVALWLLPYCAHTRAPRTVVTASGELIRVHDRAFTCEGDLVDEQVHQQAGGGVTVERELANGVQFGGSLEAVSGRMLEHRGSTQPVPGRTPYVIGSAGAQVGYDHRWFSVDAGARLYLASGRELSAAPWLWARAGRMDRVWGELGVGPRRGAFDPVFFGFGAGFQAGLLGGSGGFAWIGRRYREQLEPEESSPAFASYRDRALDPAGYLELDLALNERTRLGVRAIVGHQPSGRLTLRFAFPDPVTR